MLRDPLSPARVTVAACGSLKRMAETLLAPMICACADKVRTRFWRNVIWSYAKNPAHASSKATPLTTMFINMMRVEIEFGRIAAMTLSIYLPTTLRATFNNSELSTK